MSVNGITGASDAYSTYSAASKTAQTKASEKAVSDKTSEKDTAAVYEPSKKTTTTTTTKKTYKPDTATIARLKADAEQRTSQLQSLVEKILIGQGKVYNNANDIWSVLSSGNFTVDAATKAQAQADIADDGYWGVSQTSQRILDFATALTGGDPDKIDAMQAAFKKGYEKAQKTWGGQLPDICQKTYDAVLKGFDDMRKQNADTTSEVQ
ncbi:MULTISPECIES: hypothetical protein [Suilimivivens]|uniref:Uncharacterized protein n=1 Tax=Suilimivivens aceti TaxID=2981774 RepID=A0ABT2SZ29_9FIRM|nr:hypothetical protein [Suilimivivens aceti]MCU6742977.1 hypothetical protein [Suilimivivens aceti]RHV49015.1 hypothetical protein DXB46_08550 [Lachnospiraceae bacterium OM04-12BH]SCG95384.1 Uncharacterised protein [uncultured Clostridium sp.]